MNLLDPYARQIARGTSKNFSLSVQDGSGGHVDITDCRLVFSIKRTITDPFPIVQKTSAHSDQIEIIKPLRGLATIKLVPADTHNLDPGVYVYDLWIVLKTGSRYQIIPPSAFVVEAAVTVLPL
jgi:hypothetical protein